MYVRITRGRFQPERIDDVEALSSSIAEAIKTLPGFLGSQGGVDQNTSTIVAISNWEDRGSAEFPRDKLGDVFDRITALVQLEPAEIYETKITALSFPHSPKNFPSHHQATTHYRGSS